MYDIKRQQDRDSPQKGKRSRYSYDDDIRDRMSPDIDRRMKRSLDREPKMREREYDLLDSADRYGSTASRRFKHDRTYSDPYEHQPRISERQSLQGDFRTLCVSNINPNIPDTVLRDTLFKDFKKFGELNIKIVHHSDQRVVYLNYRYAEDAIDAQLSRRRYLLFDDPVRIEPVYPKGTAGYSFTEPRDDFRSRRTSPGRGRPAASQSSEFYARSESEFGFEKTNRSEPKFPHHLQHIDPEDDVNATRTLFAGNLDYNIAEEDLREIFNRFGDVEEIDIKRPTKGSGNAYAFIKYRNLDMAHKAKVSFSGQYIGRYQCKIGYGKVNPTTCLWIGGLGPWIKPETLEEEFDRFGAIHRLEWPRGKDYAYVLYDNVDAAQAANTEMRGFPLGGPDRRIRVDFADPNVLIGGGPVGSPVRRKEDSFGSPPPGFGSGPSSSERDRSSFDRSTRSSQWSSNKSESWRDQNNTRGSPPLDYERPRNKSDSRRPEKKRPHSPYEDDRGRRSRTPMDNQDFSPVREKEMSRHRSRTPPPKKLRASPDAGIPASRSTNNRTSNDGRRTSISEDNDVMEATSVVEFPKCLPSVWKGALVLKSSAFGCRFYHITGDVSLVDLLIGDSDEGKMLRITQRLRLDQPKLDEVGRRVESSGSSGHTVLLALPSNTAPETNGGLQARPLKNLVSYLKQKEAAGVISLPVKQGKDKEEGGVLHAFPPCRFGHNYLLQRAPNLGAEPSKEDHLVIIIVKGV